MNVNSLLLETLYELIVRAWPWRMWNLVASFIHFDMFIHKIKITSRVSHVSLYPNTFLAYHNYLITTLVSKSFRWSIKDSFYEHPFLFFFLVWKYICLLGMASYCNMIYWSHLIQMPNSCFIEFKDVRDKWFFFWKILTFKKIQTYIFHLLKSLTQQ